MSKQKMKTVNEVCLMMHVTRKTLYYYDKVGILKPTIRAGKQKAKLYDEEQLLKLQMILKYALFKELVDSPQKRTEKTEEVSMIYL